MSQKPLPYQNKGDLTKGPVEKHLIRLTVPMIWGLVAVISVQIADTYFISKLGTRELAGIGFTFPVTMLITHLLFGLNIAMSSVISRMIGAGDKDSARRVTLHGIMLAVCTSAVIALITFIFLDPLFTLLGAGPETLPVVQAYMPIWLIASVVLAIPVNGNSAVRAAGDATWPALVMVSMAITNVILDPILIFGLYGFPEMGVSGAATATLIAYCVSLCGGLYVLIIKKQMVPRDGLHLDKFKDSVRRLVFIAIPAGITNIIGPLTSAIVVALLARFGPEAVAAFGVVTRIEGLALILVISLSLGMTPIIGQNWGAENFERVHKTINLSIGFNFIWSFLVAVILALGAQSIAGAFSDNPVVVNYAVLFFYIVPVSYAFGNLVFGWASVFNAMGKPQRSFVMIVVKAFVLTIPGVYIGSYLGGVTGIYIGLMAANFISGIVFHLLSWRTCLSEEKEEHSPARG